jgi:hypothetical protein
VTAPASKGAKKVKAKAPSNQNRWSKGEEDHDPDVEQIVRCPPFPNAPHTAEASFRPLASPRPLHATDCAHVYLPPLVPTPLGGDDDLGGGVRRGLPPAHVTC